MPELSNARAPLSGVPSATGLEFNVGSSRQFVDWKEREGDEHLDPPQL